MDNKIIFEFPGFSFGCEIQSLAIKETKDYCNVDIPFVEETRNSNSELFDDLFDDDDVSINLNGIQENMEQRETNQGSKLNFPHPTYERNDCKYYDLSSTSSPIPSIPRDNLLQILRFVRTHQNINSFRCCCKLFMSICEHDSLWDDSVFSRFDDGLTSSNASYATKGTCDNNSDIKIDISTTGTWICPSCRLTQAFASSLFCEMCNSPKPELTNTISHTPHTVLKSVADFSKLWIQGRQQVDEIVGDRLPAVRTLTEKNRDGILLSPKDSDSKPIKYNSWNTGNSQTSFIINQEDRGNHPSLSSKDKPEELLSYVGISHFIYKTIRLESKITKRWGILNCGWEWVKRELRKKLHHRWTADMGIDMKSCLNIFHDKNKLAWVESAMVSTRMIRTDGRQSYHDQQNHFMTDSDDCVFVSNETGHIYGCVNYYQSPVITPNTPLRPTSVSNFGPRPYPSNPVTVMVSDGRNSDVSNKRLCHDQRVHSLSPWKNQQSTPAQHHNSSSKKSINHTLEKVLRKLCHKNWMTLYDSLRSEFNIQCDAISRDLHSIWIHLQVERSQHTTYVSSKNNTDDKTYHTDCSSFEQHTNNRHSSYCEYNTRNYSQDEDHNAYGAADAAMVSLIFLDVVYHSILNYLDWIEELEEFCWDLNDSITNDRENNIMTHGCGYDLPHKTGDSDRVPCHTQRTPHLMDMGVISLRSYTLLKPALKNILTSCINTLIKTAEAVEIPITSKPSQDTTRNDINGIHSMQGVESSPKSLIMSSEYLIDFLMRYLKLMERLDVSDDSFSDNNLRTQKSHRLLFIQRLHSLPCLASHIRAAEKKRRQDEISFGWEDIDEDRLQMLCDGNGRKRRGV